MNTGYKNRDKMWSENCQSIDERDQCDTSSVIQVFNALKLTPKGKLQYDRDPKSPPPYIPKCNKTQKEKESKSETTTKSPIPSMSDYTSCLEKERNLIGIDTDKYQKRNQEALEENLSNNQPKTTSDYIQENTSKVSNVFTSPLQDKETRKKQHDKESIIPLNITKDEFEDTDDGDRNLCKQLREHWSIDDKEAIVVLERISLLGMETMRKKGQTVDNALTAMELKRRAQVQKKLEEKQNEMQKKSEDCLNKAKAVYMKNIALYHQREKAQKEDEARQSLELQKKLDEVRIRQQEENRLSKQQRDDRLRLELQKAAEQQYQQRKIQEEARLAQEAEIKKKADEEKRRKLELSKNKAILSATEALRLYNEVLTVSDNILTKEQGEAYLVNTLGISLDVVNTPIVAETITRLSTTDNVMVIEQETNELQKLVNLIHNAIDGLSSAKKIAEQKLLEEKLREETAAKQEESVNSNFGRRQSLNTVASDSVTKNIAAAPQISESNLNRYSQVRDIQLSFSKRIEKLEDKQGSQIKNTVRKKVNVPVNAIAATNSEHMKDKLIKLRQLLSGNLNVPDATDLQLANDFARNLLAIKFVKQGEVEVSNKRVGDEGFQGFAYAAIISALWADHPDFGQLYLAYTYDTCPYLIPQIPSDLPANPSKQDYENRGYKYEEDGTVEKQEKFVTRMSGVARLLACVAVSPLPSGEQGKEHPFGLGNIWRWLCSTLNLPPVNDVTATLLHDVLEITASRLIEQYNKHFLEIIRLLNDVYLDKIKAATIEGSGGPIVRLEQFLKKIINNPSTIKAPSASRLKSGLNYL